MQQIEIDWDNITHTKENCRHSEAILDAQYERLNNNCRIIYTALLRGERLTGMDIMQRYGMCEYRKRISDIRATGIDIKETTLKNGAKIWYL